MSSVNQKQLRRILADRLESLQMAGVLQLPRGIRWQPVLDGTAPPVAGLGDVNVATSEGLDANNESAAIMSPTENEPQHILNQPAVTDVEPSMAKKTGWQAAKPTSLFDTPSTSAESRVPGLTLEVLQQQVATCTRCTELASTRTQTVFGVGNTKTRLCFLGEAPGADEDKTGIPFVGRAGQLLTKIIEACKLKRDDVYILNMIKCRPPGNRNPLPQELANCRGYLESQLDLIQPEFICCLGAVAAQNLLGSTLSIGKLRGTIHSFRGTKVVCTYHPAFLLRSPSFKKETWEDMKLLMREMGVEL